MAGHKKWRRPWGAAPNFYYNPLVVLAEETLTLLAGSPVAIVDSLIGKLDHLRTSQLPAGSLGAGCRSGQGVEIRVHLNPQAVVFDAALYFQVRQVVQGARGRAGSQGRRMAL